MDLHLLKFYFYKDIWQQIKMIQNFLVKKFDNKLEKAQM